MVVLRNSRDARTRRDVNAYCEVRCLESESEDGGYTFVMGEWESERVAGRLAYMWQRAVDRGVLSRGYKLGRCGELRLRRTNGPCYARLDKILDEICF